MTKKEKKQPTSIRTSLTLSIQLLKAMDIVKAHEGASKRAQTEIGLKMFFERHKELLRSNGIDLWNSK